MKQNITLTNKQYDVLKKLCLVAVPIATCIMSVSAALGWDFGSVLGAILGAVAAAAGEVMQISSSNYNAGSNEAVEEEDGADEDSE